MFPSFQRIFTSQETFPFILRYSYAMSVCQLREVGFSLLEFLCVMSLSLGIAWFTIPELGKLRRSILFKKEVVAIEALLREARVIALEEQRTTHISTQSSCFSLSTKHDSRVRRSLCVPPSFSLTAPEEGISFYPHQVNTPARVLLYERDLFCEVILSLRGRIRTRCS